MMVAIQSSVCSDLGREHLHGVHLGRGGGEVGMVHPFALQHCRLRYLPGQDLQGRS